MRTLFSGSIHESLTIIVLLAVLPAMAINIYTGFESNRHAERDVHERNVNLIRSLAAMQRGITNEARVLLTALARMPEMQAGDMRACDQYFATLMADHAELSAIFLIDKDGIVVASGLPALLGVHLADRTYFQDVKASMAFSVGTYNIGRASGLPIQVFALPVLATDGSLLGVLGASFRLDIYHAFLQQLQLPPEAREGFFDRNGLRMMAYPSSEAYPLGQALISPLWDRISRASADEGTFSGARPDGAMALVAYSRLRLTPSSPPYLTIVVSMTSAEAFRSARMFFARSMALLALAAVLALVIARRVGRMAVLGGLDRLVGASARLGMGELGARAGDTGGSREVRQLGATFDTMAEALQTRQLELQHATEALAKTRNLLDNILESMPSAIIGLDAQGRITHFNASAQSISGLSLDRAMGRPVLDALARHGPVHGQAATGLAPSSDAAGGAHGPASRRRGPFAGYPVLPPGGQWCGRGGHSPG